MYEVVMRSRKDVRRSADKQMYARLRVTVSPPATPERLMAQNGTTRTGVWIQVCTGCPSLFFAGSTSADMTDVQIFALN